MTKLASDFFKAYNELTLREKDLGFYEKKEFNKDGSLRKTTGTLQYVIPDRPDGSGVVHHSLNHCATTTGRLSSSRPNMQQVPRDSKVKQMFTSHYGPEGWVAQCDYCFEAGTPILGADFKYKDVATLQVGDELVGFDEHTGTSSADRKFRRAVVTKTKVLVKESYKVTLSSGDSFVCSGDHMWLARTVKTHKLMWVRTDALKVGNTFTQAVPYWETAVGEDAGYVRGILDGEGWVQNGRWGIGQKYEGDNKLVCDAIVDAFKKCGDELKSSHTRNDMVNYYTDCGKMPRSSWYVVGKYQPIRLMAKLQRLWEGTTTRSRYNLNPEVVSVEYLGEREVVAVQTSTGTMIAKGYLTHNCAMEVVMGCVLTGDKKLLSLLEAGTDMHCYRLAFQEGKPYEEVYELCHNPDAPDHKEWKKKRTAIKTYSFASQYGASAKGLAFASGGSVEDAQRFLDNEAKLFPESIAYRDVIADEVNRTALLEPMRREQSDDGSWRIYREGYFTAPCGTRYRFRQKPVWREGKQVMDFKPTEMANYPFQGSGSLLMLIAMGMIMRAGLACNWMGGKIKLMNTVHDASYMSCADEETAKAAAVMLKHCMEGARDRMLQLWPDFGILKDVHFPAEGGYGKSLKEEYTI